MAKSKSEQKRLAAQKSTTLREVTLGHVSDPVPAEKFDGLMLTVKYSLQVGKPVISFEGAWTTRDFKNILRAIPRAYRQYLVNLRKQLEASKQGETHVS